jgi:hypothetical protein
MARKRDNHSEGEPGYRKASGARKKVAVAATELGRDHTGRFRKGMSGNPNGRPKSLVSFIELARQKGSPVAFKALLRVTQYSKDERAIVQAALGLLAYAWGKPKQAVEVTGKDGAPVEVNDARERLIARISARLTALGADGAAREPKRYGR